MCPEITNLYASMNGRIRATLSTGQIINDMTNIVCHSISTNRSDPIWLHNSNYKRAN
jgi:hypothetical protein